MTCMSSHTKERGEKGAKGTAAQGPTKGKRITLTTTGIDNWDPNRVNSPGRESIALGPPNSLIQHCVPEKNTICHHFFKHTSILVAFFVPRRYNVSTHIHTVPAFFNRVHSTTTQSVYKKHYYATLVEPPSLPTLMTSHVTFW